jgi:amino acid transporter
MAYPDGLNTSELWSRDVESRITSTQVPTPSTANAPGLLRGLRRADILALTFNNIVGAGIFTLPAVLAAAAGSWSVGVLIVVALVVVAMALCMVEVASRYDQTGGPLCYAGMAFGPLAGFTVGWLMYLSRLSAFGAVAVTGLDYAAGVWPALGTAPGRAVAITAFVGTLAFVNVRGVVYGALASTVLTVVKLVPLVILALAGMWFVNRAPEMAWPTGPRLDTLGDAVLLAFFACMGFESAAILAGESRTPRRDLLPGLVGGVSGATVLYALLLVVCFWHVPALARASRPLADAAAALAGPAGAVAMALTAAFSCAGNLSVSMVVSPRVLYALAEQGDVPRIFSSVHAWRRTPAVAILTHAALVWVLTLTGTFVYLATFSATTRLLTYASTCAALIALRKRDGPAPVTIPAGGLLAALALASTAAALSTTSGSAVRDLSIALALGFALRALPASRRRVAPSIDI